MVCRHFPKQFNPLSHRKEISWLNLIQNKPCFSFDTLPLGHLSHPLLVSFSTSTISRMLTPESLPPDQMSVMSILSYRSLSRTGMQALQNQSIVCTQLSKTKALSVPSSPKPKHCLTHSSYWINICWMNEWATKWTVYPAINWTHPS